MIFISLDVWLLISCASAVLFVITDKCAAIHGSVSLPQEGLTNGFKFCELKTDLLEVECTPVLDLSQWEWVHVHKGHGHQLSVRNAASIVITI